MDKLIIIFLLSCFSYAALAQRPNCIDVNFENLPNQNPIEGDSITDQYLNIFGIRFSSSPGFTPLLAQVGGTATAFGSAWGNDTPRPGVDVGQYFITDDGALSGLIGQPLIINFERPIYYASGCILDIDLSEIFTITAYGENDEVLFTRVIADGDPIAGDGAVSCWEFEYNICPGIDSIVIQGTRTQDGFFGFGHDNFQFCYLIPRPDISVINATCQQNNASVAFVSNDETNSTFYTFNGTTFQFDTTFSDLASGDYLLNIFNNGGCSDSLIVTITDIPPSSIIDVDIVPSNCDQNNGSLIGIASGTNNTYSINNIDYQSSPTFNNLGAGTYTLFMLDENGCPSSIEAVIEAIPPPQIDLIETEPDFCNDFIGSIEIMANGYALTYSINGEDFFSTSIFTGLPQGDYSISVRDSFDCIVTERIGLEGTPAILIADIVTDPTDCEINNGQIAISLANNNQIITATINNSLPQSNTIFNGLESGNYDILIANQFNCQVDTSLFIDQNRCPIFVPNIFTPNADGTNDRLNIFPHVKFRGQIISLHIFNRWGDHVYDASNYNPEIGGWDGIYRGEEAPVGVYVYYMDAIFPDGQTKIYKGDFTLIR